MGTVRYYLTVLTLCTAGSKAGNEFLICPAGIMTVKYHVLCRQIWILHRIIGS